MDEIKLTLEVLYDILRNEKKREDLQKLEASFYIDVVSYLQEKKTLLENKKSDTNLFAAGEKEKLEYELRSIRRILREIFEKREKKIIDIALNRSRTGSDIIDTSSMLFEEKNFYERILHILEGHRQGVLQRLVNAQVPHFEESSGVFTPLLPNPKPAQAYTSEEEQDPSEKKKVRFIHPTPSFVWKDLKVYGPYDIGDTIDIFPEVADLLVRKKRAEFI